MTDRFELHSEFAPAGDQPRAIEALVSGFRPALHTKCCSA